LKHFIFPPKPYIVSLAARSFIEESEAGQKFVAWHRYLQKESLNNEVSPIRGVSPSSNLLAKIGKKKPFPSFLLLILMAKDVE
jgi:hypothetical protein